MMATTMLRREYWGKKLGSYESVAGVGGGDLEASVGVPGAASK